MKYLEDVQKLFHHLWPQLLRHSVSVIVWDICKDLQQRKYNAVSAQGQCGSY